MSFTFTLNLPSSAGTASVQPTATSSPLKEEPNLASYRANNPGFRESTGGAAYSGPGYLWNARSEEYAGAGADSKDPVYSETDTRRNAICGLLGDNDPSYFETKAAQIYGILLNNRSYLWSKPSFTVSLLLVTGPGFRIASFASYMIIVLVGAWLNPMLTDQFPLTRGEEIGDFMVRLTWGLWIASATIFAISRCCYRLDHYPWGQAAVFPDMLLNDRLPLEGDMDYRLTVWMLWAWAILGVLVVFTAIHTVLGQLYVAQNMWYGVLLMLFCSYEFVAALSDIARCGSPFGLPKGWARWLRVFRAIVVVPMKFIFSGWVIFVADPVW